jgi:hypothetical protein
MITVYPSLTTTDVVITLSNLWDDSDSCMFLDASEDNFHACSLTFFKGVNRSTVGIVYTTQGGMARIFNSDMETIAQSVGKFTIADYHGIRNMMFKIQKALPLPDGISMDDIIDVKEII